MIANLHTHTTFSDGSSTAEEMAEAALRLGVDVLGFSDHSFLPGVSWGMPLERYPAYRAEIERLRRAYSGKLRILCGLEQDLDSPPPPDGFDYLIGSVHYVHPCGQSFNVDHSPSAFREAVDTLYGGDPYALCEDYYRAMIRLADMPCDIIGHFDLITKFNENNAFFSEEHPRYQAAVKAALDVLLKTGRVFELNTGAISRGYRTVPYPARRIVDCIRDGGGKLILSSDTHSAKTVTFAFDEWEQKLGVRPDGLEANSGSRP